MFSFIVSIRSASDQFDVAEIFRRLRQDRLRKRAAYRSLQRLLDRSDDFLLEDVGIDRETAHRLLGETMIVPHRAWDRWQG